MEPLSASLGMTKVPWGRPQDQGGGKDGLFSKAAERPLATALGTCPAPPPRQKKQVPIFYKGTTEEAPAQLSLLGL